jgi:tetratricopeptide (TPR) repeat protein
MLEIAGRGGRSHGGDVALDTSITETGPDPRRAHDLGGLAAELGLLRRRAASGMRKAQVSLQDLARRVDLPRSTVHAHVTGKTLPSPDVLDKIVIALGADEPEQRAWADAWHRVYDRIERQRRAARAGKKLGWAGPRPDGSPTGAAPVPRQLPPDVAGFTARARELAALDELLGSARAEGRVAIGVISGPAGVGKTTLAVHWAYQVAGQFPDGQLYVNLQGFDPSKSPVAPGEAVRGFLDALGVARQTLPPGLAEQTALYRSMLSGRRVLVLLDNARDVEQVRPLLPGSPGSLVLVTSRHLFGGLVAVEGAHPLVLGLLSARDARELLTRRLGEARLATEPAAVGDIVTACARLPLALGIVAGRAATHPHFPLRAVAAELRDSRARLDALAGDLRAVFSCSYDALTPGAARLFRLIGLHPGPDVSAPAAASLAGAGLAQVRPLLAELAHANLISEHVPGRYVSHDLLRAYAAELAAGVDPSHLRRAATHRMLDHYLHTACAADRLVDPTQDPITPIPPLPGTTVEAFSGRDQALGWFTAEHAVLLAAVDHAASAGYERHAWQLAWTLLIYLDWRGFWHDQVGVQRAGLAAAERLADLPAQARSHRNLGRACTQLLCFPDAGVHFRQALDLYRRAGDRAGQAHIHLALGLWASRQGRRVEAIEYERQALELFRTEGCPSPEAHVLNNLGWSYALRGDYQQALARCQQALSLHEQLGNLDGQACAWDSIGYARHHLGDHRAAVMCYQRALDLFQEMGNRYQEADTLRRLADTHQAVGDAETARAAREQALTILDDLGHPDAERVRAKLAD